MRVHFIAVGGAVMHNLAIALHKKGYVVTGSDDEIFEPSKSRLEKNGLLPASWGWHPELISSSIDTIILGMHAKADNPELIRSRELGLKIMSFPEYLYEQTKDKTRIVIAGSHGKTTTTAMILHVMRHAGIRFDYMVGSQIDGFDTMVGLSDESTVAVFEGDEYLTSALDPRPKFHLYMPDIAVINGIAWDHKNVFPTFENYVSQFRIFTQKISSGGKLIYFRGDPEVKKLADSVSGNFSKIPYDIHEYSQNQTGYSAMTSGGAIPLKIFGEHNMQNLSAAHEVSKATGISDNDFYKAISRFEGTSRRLQKLGENEKGLLYIDFAHSPSKVKATVEAVASRYQGREIIVCLELHTYSSLSSDFLPLYNGTLSGASRAYVYFNPHAIALKKLSSISKNEVREAFGGNNIEVYDNSVEMFSIIKSRSYKSPVWLIMSSGDFDGFDIQSLIE
jgi:UDP-N-acetylmuramate: L-alanyl-gamma-D-glutamyl-meso-diaminopimelate ligase